MFSPSNFESSGGFPATFAFRDGSCSSKSLHYDMHRSQSPRSSHCLSLRVSACLCDLGVSNFSVVSNKYVVSGCILYNKFIIWCPTESISALPSVQHSVPSYFCQNAQTCPGTAEKVSCHMRSLNCPKVFHSKSSAQHGQLRQFFNSRMPQKKLKETQSISKSSKSSNLMKSVNFTKNFSNFSTPGPAVPGDFSREDWLSGRSATYLAKLWRKTRQMHQITLALGKDCIFGR